MQIVAYQKNTRVSPRKLRLVADVVRNLKPDIALSQLQFMHKDAAKPLFKVLKQAISNAVNNNNIAQKNLKIEHILIEEGPRYKRWRAASRGRARTIIKRTSHIKIILKADQPKDFNLKETKKEPTKNIKKSVSVKKDGQTKK